MEDINQNPLFITSPTTGKLIGAWIAAKEEMGSVVEFDSKNPHFKSKFASLEATLKKVSPVFSKHGLALIQFPAGGHLINRLEHAESGEWMQSSYEMIPVKKDPQAFGSALTYARRYCLQAIAGLSGGEDDDAESAMPDRTPTQKPQPSSLPNGVSVDSIVNNFINAGYSSAEDAKLALEENWNDLMNQVKSLNDRKELANKLNRWVSSLKGSSEEL